LKNRTNSLLLSTALASALVFSVTGCNKPSEPIEKPVASTTIGTEIDDSVITSSVKAALLADADIKSFDFKVETRKGEVMLSGFVDSQNQIDLAKSTVLAVAGVKGIQNNVTIKGAPTSVGNKVDDTIITSRVKAALLADEQIKSLDIAVVTRKGEVQLSGFVNNQDQITRAMAAARGVQEVQKVINELQIKK